jgi:large subunit ribosomal protein L15
MEQYQIQKPDSAKKRKRVGRGPGSGHGKTCCRGENGQLSRSGSGHRPWFEGGQMPIQRRIPKRGFNNKIFRNEFQIVNLDQLVGLSGEVTVEVLYNKNLVSNKELPVKVLGTGEVSVALTVTVDAFSASAKEKIEKAGGKAIIKK